MSSVEAEPTGGAEPPEPDTPAEPVDEVRAELLAAFERELGDRVVGSHIRTGETLWVRVATDAWREAGHFARHGLDFGYFCFLSAIDWMPSPYGRYEDAEVDRPFVLATPTEDYPRGYAGGDTRMQVFARLVSVRDHRNVILEADVPDDEPVIDSWVPVFAGADWHERETWEMYGITFTGHPHLKHIYLPGDFEGFPLRKDYPLLARVVKPWPGIVDVEPMPGEPEGEAEDETAEADA